MERNEKIERIKIAFANGNVKKVQFMYDGSGVYFEYVYNFVSYFHTMPMDEAIECMKGRRII